MNKKLLSTAIASMLIFIPSKAIAQKYSEIENHCYEEEEED